MRRTHNIKRTAFLLSGNDLKHVLKAGIKDQLGGEDLGILVAVEFHGSDEPTLDVIFEKEID